MFLFIFFIFSKAIFLRKFIHWYSKWAKVTYRKSSEVIPEMVVWLEFWFHMRASVVRWPSAASRICSGVQSMPSFSKFVSNQLSSYQPTEINSYVTYNDEKIKKLLYWACGRKRRGEV